MPDDQIAADAVDPDSILTVPEPQHFLTIPQAAACLGISRSTIYELIDAGDIYRVKIKNRALVPAVSIRAYVARVLAEQVGAGVHLLASA